MRHPICWAFAASVLIFAVQMSESVAAQSIPHDTLVSVGAYRLHFRIFRGGEPVVLLESGGVLDASQWDRLAPRIVEETGATVVAYDRAGLGQSDLPSTPYDIREEVAGLWRGLERLELTERVLLVGHSYGAFLIRVEASEHSDAVMGLVYIDPNVPSFAARVSTETLDSIFGPPPQGPTKHERAARRQVEGYESTIRIVAASTVPPSMPLRVITAGRPWWPTPELNRAFREAHERLANSVSDGQLLVAERSGHMIPESEPEVIINVIRELIRTH